MILNCKQSMRIACIFFVFLVVFLIPMEIYSQILPDSTIQIPKSSMTNSDLNLGMALFRTIFSFAAVTVLLIATLYGIKWMKKKVQSGTGDNQMLGIIATITLGPKKSVHLIKVIDRILVIGATEGNMSFLTELTKEEIDIFNTKYKIHEHFATTLANRLKRTGGEQKL